MVAAVWPLVALIGSVALVLALETLPLWQSFGAALLALDFDQERVAMLQSLAAGLLVAAVGGTLTGRPWVSSLVAAGFVWVAYAGPLGTRLSHDIPSLLGVREQLVPSALVKNQVIIVALAFLAAVPAAGFGRLAHITARRATAVSWPDPFQPSPTIRVIAGALLAVTATTSVALAVWGADPLLRIGPSYGVYRLPAAPGGKLADPASPGIVETVPTAGQVLSRTYPSGAMGEVRPYRIYLPPTYQLRAAAHRHYPVLYLLHGDPSSPSEWLGLGAPALFDGGITRDRLPEMILVMPDGNGHVTTATQWADRADGRDKVESALLELVDVIDRDYRTIPDRGHRVIAGISSGGFGAANIAARHPDRFGTAMSFAGTFVANGPVFGNGPYARANSPYFLVQDDPSARTVRFILVVGSSDAWRKQAAEQFAAQLSRFGVSHELAYVPGGHAAGVWIGGLALGMQRIAEPLSTPVARLADETLRPRS